MKTNDVKAHRERFKNAVSDYLGGDLYVNLFWKGRVAFYAILRALGIGSGDEVIVPGFTCIVVPNALLYAGAEPVYADIDASTYTISRETVEPLITSKTKAIVTQNTFGLSTDLDPILELGRERGIEIVDDCAHGLGGAYKGQKNGILTRSSFFSTQWNKPISTGLGGVTVTKDERLARRLARLEEETIAPSVIERHTLRLLHAVRNNLVRGKSYWAMVEFYRWLGKRGVVAGSSTLSEIETTSRPAGYFKRMSDFQAKVGVEELSRLDEYNTFRKKKAEKYDEVLREIGKSCPERPQYADHCFLKYPIRVSDRATVMREARRLRIRLGDWFVSPLHPVNRDLSGWKFRKGSCPVAEGVAGEIINLPTDPDVQNKEVERTREFLIEHSKRVL